MDERYVLRVKAALEAGSTSTSCSVGHLRFGSLSACCCLDMDPWSDILQASP